MPQPVGLRAVHRDEGAQGIVEFALIFPILALLIFGIIDLARAVWQSNTLAYAAREGTRYAIVHGSAGSGSPPVLVTAGTTTNTCSSALAQPPLSNCQPVYDVVRNAAVGVWNITVVVTWRDTIGATPCYDRSCHVAVDATAPFVPLPSQYMVGGAFQITLRGGSELVIQR
jgi:Flp pilus assembly protein TadG